MLLDLTMLGRAWHQSGTADDLLTVRGLRISDAPRDGSAIHAWTSRLDEILIKWDVEDDDAWEVVGEDEPRWLSDADLLCWRPAI